MTKLLGVIGDPISHSLSPLVHNGWLRDLGIDATYEAMHVRAREFPSALKTLESRDVLGVNVTLPHKHVALETASSASESAQRIGAANTLTYTDQKGWHADNSDAPGFMHALGAFGEDVGEVLLLGAGGSARAIVFALTNIGIPVRILNRTVSKATTIAQEFGPQLVKSGPLDQYEEYISSAKIVINTTSMGYGGELLNLPEGHGRLFFDISYGRIAAPQLSYAERTGWQTRDGLSMLVAQAAFSFQIWFGEMPDVEAGLRRCRIALEAVS